MPIIEVPTVVRRRTSKYVDPEMLPVILEEVSQGYSGDGKTYDNQKDATRVCMAYRAKVAAENEDMKVRTRIFESSDGWVWAINVLPKEDAPATTDAKDKSK